MPGSISRDFGVTKIIILIYYTNTSSTSRFLSIFTSQSLFLKLFITTAKMIIDDIALTMITNAGPKTTAYLLQCFGSAQNIFNASADDLLKIARLRKDIAADIVRKSTHKQAEKEVKYCEKNDIVPIASDSQSYPVFLRECEDYPHVIYFRGDTDALSKSMLSMVGTRQITSYGKKICDKLVAELAQAFPDIAIVSGLAFGVDGACHRAAVAHSVTTIGVLADTLAAPVYPAQHAALADQMMKQGGGLISEYHSGHKHKGVTFIPRNRIIAGMSMGTIVVESPLKGGSMITAYLADGYNRCVMAVPGRVGDSSSEGTNELIKTNKARMVCSAADIARELMWDMPETGGSPAQRDLSSLSKDAAGLLDCIPDGEALSIDELTSVTGLSAPELAAIVIELEFENLIRVLPGKMYERA